MHGWWGRGLRGANRRERSGAHRIDNVRHGLAEMSAARECFEATIATIDVLTSMLAGLEALFDD